MQTSLYWSNCLNSIPCSYLIINIDRITAAILYTIFAADVYKDDDGGVGFIFSFFQHLQHNNTA